MIAYITTREELAAGIRSSTVTVSDLPDYDADEIEGVRRALALCFSEILDEGVSVTFSDEGDYYPEEEHDGC